MHSAADICAALRVGRFDLHDEKECQTQIADWLAELLPGADISREHRLSAQDIPDFLVGTVIVEVKMNGARPAGISRQLERYAAHEQVTDVILVTNRAAVLPATVGGKPLAVVSLGRAWL